MAVLVCPRCRHVNPAVASFCYFDGQPLRAGVDGGAGQLAREFFFPSGRRCRSYDEFAQACRDEWPAARDLLRQGIFTQFFGGAGRGDLARAAQEALAQADSDIALTTFLSALPVSLTYQPKIDAEPRRFALGTLLAGEARPLTLKILNRGQGNLQGTLKVSEGGAWLKLEGGAESCSISTSREQVVKLTVNTRGLPAGQAHAGLLTLITNGGVDEIPVRFDLAAQPFAKAPFQGVRAPREMAERMRKQPKAAGPILESGELAQWFATNGWMFPVQGPTAKGVAAVQQFFEAMGLSRPPPVQVAQPEYRFRCRYTEPLRFQVTLNTPAKKWIYAHATSDRPWLKLLTPLATGPQHATFQLEIEPKLMAEGNHGEAKLGIVANGGQNLSVRVLVDVEGVPVAARAWPIPAATTSAAIIPAATTSTATARPESARRGSSWLAALLAPVLLFLLLRLVLIPVVDVPGRGPQLQAALTRALQTPVADDALFHQGQWLMLPWSSILTAATGKLPATVFHLESGQEVEVSELRHFFFNYLLRKIMLWTFWLGPLFGVMLVRRRGGSLLDLGWGIVAGVVAGAMAGATIGAVFLALEIVPHTVWGLVLAGQGGPGWLVVWILLALGCWALVGAALGLAALLVPMGRRLFLEPVQNLLARLCRLFGLRGLADLFAAA